MANRLLSPLPFLLADQYASALTTLGLGVLWMPVLPLSPYLALLGGWRVQGRACALLPCCSPMLRRPHVMPWSAVLPCPATPSQRPLCPAGLFLQYWADKIVALR